MVATTVETFAARSGRGRDRTNQGRWSNRGNPLIEGQQTMVGLGSQTGQLGDRRPLREGSRHVGGHNNIVAHIAEHDIEGINA